MTDHELLQQIQQHPDRAVTAAEISDEIELTSAAILHRLNQLSDENKVRRKSVGAGAVVWWVQS